MFYFSGHGYQNEEAYFILKDTDMSKIRSTSLGNDEIDDLIRDYQPKLWVKIIDACQSGLTYIKSVDQTDMNIRTNKSFENCIFMSSSKKTQASMATQEYSLFTKVFVEAVLRLVEEEQIRYIDIQNYVSDVFSGEKMQTPFFVSQSDGRDIFANTTEELKQLAAEFFKVVSDFSVEANAMEKEIEDYLCSYRDVTQVKKFIKRFKEVLEEEIKANTYMEKYYEWVFTSSSQSVYREDSGILKFLYKRREDENLAVKFTTEKVKDENWLGIATFKTVPIYFENLAHELPTASIVKLKPKQDGLPLYEMLFVFVYSDTYMYVLHNTKMYIFKGWSQFLEGDSQGYSYKRMDYEDITDECLEEYIKARVQETIDFITKSLKSFIK